MAIGPARIWRQPSEPQQISNQPGHRVTFRQIEAKIIDLATEISAVEPADVMAALAAILRDPQLSNEIRLRLAEGSDAAEAIRGAFASFARRLEALGGYFGERAADLTDLGERLTLRLTNGIASGGNHVANGQAASGQLATNSAHIVVAQRLSPVDVSRFDTELVLGFITQEGGVTSHTAVVARAQNFPAILSVIGVEQIRDGDLLLLDSSSGQVFVNPEPELVQTYREAAVLAQAEIPKQVAQHQSSAVPIYANIGSPTEGRSALVYGADGVGLYRSELMFLGRPKPPSLQEQVFEYSRLLARFSGRRVIVRLLDLDSDKPLPFLKPAEDGRYTGRGLSTLLLNRAVLVTQLEALKRASDYYPETDLWVMAPMVTAVEQAKQYAALARQTGIAVVGVMIEVPEVTEPKVLQVLLETVDFISIGTNDLTRYTLELNRELGMRVTDTKDLRVLNQVEAVIRAAAASGVPVGVCGEAAADNDLAKLFIEWGVSSLSASPALIPALRSGLASA